MTTFVARVEVEAPNQQHALSMLMRCGDGVTVRHMGRKRVSANTTVILKVLDGAGAVHVSELFDRARMHGWSSDSANPSGVFRAALKRLVGEGVLVSEERGFYAIKDGSDE